MRNRYERVNISSNNLRKVGILSSSRVPDPKEAGEVDHRTVVHSLG